MSEDTQNRIQSWCDAEATLGFDGTTITVEGDPPLAVEIDMGTDALSLTHSYSVTEHPPEFADEAASLLGKRGSMVAGEVITDAAATTVHLRYPIYLEGLNRQSFTVAIRDITAMVDGIGELAAQGPSAAAAPAAEESKPAAPPSEPDPEPSPAAAKPWAATHQVPPTGMAAWTEPDPTIPPATTLGAGVQLRVDERRGAWASVTANNGWTGWVDDRILQSIGGPAAAVSVTPAPVATQATATGAATPAGSTPALNLNVIGIIAGVAMAVGTFLEWGLSNAFDWPLASTWPLYEWVSWTQPRLGVLLLIAAAAVLAGSLLPQVPRAVRMLGGLVGALLSASLAVAIGLNWGWDVLKETELVGLWVTFAGSMLAFGRGSRAA